ncbi:hypothetical protein B0T26DRAFT_702394 [Lasiosphaeria miniovina]|uniref:Aminoglycoside phosphotransferase domain-containing protein n=1 Tax=Lasiosphaeria miniovina TaxID=1954250 RepID=A0AA40AUS6_9PEZI|nr:uncharacterized protein B0T26DRAFT_702394 [Lasiosphaeria miniovina]KAK0722352.1 hypothetical protein B0T26DRAFT_702394 [Lasiosphaeria miniovina]
MPPLSSNSHSSDSNWDDWSTTSTSSDSGTDTSESTCSCSSSTSTVNFGYEAFETFQLRALELAERNSALLWPESAYDVDGEIAVERMRGGGFNRVIGLSRHSGQGDYDDVQHYILRIPRYPDSDFESDMASLLFVQNYTRIETAGLVAFDRSGDNAVGSPFMIQSRAPGTNLVLGFHDLDHAARCRLARDLGYVFRQMLETKSSVPGQLVLSPPDEYGHQEVMVGPLDAGNTAPFCCYNGSHGRPRDPLAASPYDPCPAANPPFAIWLTAIFRAQKTYLEILPDDVRNRDDTTGVSLDEELDGFIEMAEGLSADGWLDNVSCSLAHLDLECRNMLVDPGAAENLSSLAVLDWDGAILGPAFMSCAPPMWLWTRTADRVCPCAQCLGELTANDDPATPEARELKQLFEDAAGPDYLRFAYQPQYRLARKLVRFALRTQYTDKDGDEASEMLDEWHDLRMQNGAVHQ